MLALLHRFHLIVLVLLFLRSLFLRRYIDRHPIRHQLLVKPIRLHLSLRQLQQSKINQCQLHLNYFLHMLRIDQQRRRLLL
jgi:hypothetical protein